MKNFEERIGVPEGMVRVIPCHHFTAQDVFLADSEPLALLEAEGKLLIANSDHRLEIRDLNQRGLVLHHFNTVDMVKQMIHCEAGNFLATLETKSSRSNEPVTYTRVYLNWWVISEGQSIRVRIAGSTPKYESDKKVLEMIELQLNQDVFWIATCKKTSTLALNHGDSIALYCFITKTDGSNTYQDFDLLLNIKLPLLAKEIALSENIIACLSTDEILVFQINFDEDEMKPFQDPSEDVQFNKNCLEWRFDFASEATKLKWQNYTQRFLHEDSFPLNISIPEIEKANKIPPIEPVEYLGPLIKVPGLEIKVEINSKYDGGGVLSKSKDIILLYRKYSCIQIQGLQLLPIYFQDNMEMDPLQAAIDKSSTSLISPLYSSQSNHLKGMGCFISGPQQGYLYNVLNGTQLLGQYTYTAPLKGAILEEDFLYVLSSDGLETYTTRLMHHILSYANHSAPTPDYKEAVCLVSICPFLSVEKLIPSENHLILVSAPDDNSSTLYSLKKPTSQELHADILETAVSNQEASPFIYIHLLEEAHMILRTQLLLKKKHVTELYQETCFLLGNYFLTTDFIQDRELAVPYYVLSLISVDKIVQQMLDIKASFKKGDYIVKYIIHFILETLIKNKTQAASISPKMTDIIIDIFMEHAPDKFWRLLLFSNMKEYESNKVLGFLKKRHRMASIADTFTLIVLLFNSGEIETSTSLLLSLKNSNFVPFLLNVTELLWDSNSPTKLGKLIVQTRAHVFLDLLASLIHKKTIDPNRAFDLLRQMTDENNFQSLRKSLIECLVSHKQLSQYRNPELVLELVNIYLQSLQADLKCPSVSPINKAIDCFFGPRPIWLQDLPPFCGRRPMERCNLKTSCLCLKCMEDLLKLQSLLCSKLVTPEIKDIINSLNSKFAGYLSLRLLCTSDVKEIIDVLVSKHPNVLFAYMLDQVPKKQAHFWCYFYQQLQKRVLKHTSSSESPHIELLKILIHQLAEFVDEDIFLALNTNDEKAILRCKERNQADLLREKIIFLGNDVKSVM